MTSTAEQRTATSRSELDLGSDDEEIFRKRGRIGAGLAAVAGLAALYGGRTVDSADVDGYGILFALPTAYWIGFALAIVATVVLISAAAKTGGRYAGLIPFLWLALLHMAPALAHRHVRFNIVWTHMGFVRLIEEQGTGDVLIDARFAWPGLFGALVAPLARLNPEVLEVILRLWPTLITGAAAVLVGALARRSYPTLPLVGSVSASLYVLLAWTGQDYFSPQGVGLLWYLSLLVIIESGPLITSTAWSKSVPFLPKFAAAGGDRPAPRSQLGFASLLLLSFGAIVSHPLAPFFVCTGLFILSVYGRRGALRLLLIVAASWVLWIAVAAQPWWSAQLPALIDQMGSFVGNLRSSTVERVSTSSPEHLLVTRVRTVVGLGTFFSVLVVGVAMATNRFRHLRPAIPLAPLAGIPAVAVAVQSYGGEIVIRILLFTLPLAVILLARVLLTVPGRFEAVPLAFLALVLTPVFLIARFGNEAFEMTTAEDRVAVEAAYAVADGPVLFVGDTGFASWRDRGIGTYEFVDIPASPTQAWIDEIEAYADEREMSRVIVVFTPSQSQWRKHGLSQSEQSLEVVVDWLKKQPGTTVHYDGERGWAVEL